MERLVLLIALAVAVSGCSMIDSSNSDERDPEETLGEMEQEMIMQSVSFEFPSLYQDQDSSNLKVILRNNGSETVNVSRLDLKYFEGEEFEEIPENCFEGERNFIEPEASYTCNTGLEFPENNISLELEFAGEKTWEKTCAPNSSDSVMC